MPAREIVELLLQATRITNASRAAGELGPAEWMALRYLARANAQSRKASMLADFEASSRAAVSRVIARLEEAGYLRREQSPSDGRSYGLEVTPAGLAMLQNDPIGSLVLAVGLLPESASRALHDALREVLTHLAEIGVRRQFDVCRDCAHLVHGPDEGDPESDGPGLTCAFFGAPLEREATKRLCGYFRPQAKSTEAMA
jgi:DNA-binding MarR family transcriptional regulator